MASLILTALAQGARWNTHGGQNLQMDNTANLLIQLSAVNNPNKRTSSLGDGSVQDTSTSSCMFEPMVTAQSPGLCGLL